MAKRSSQAAKMSEGGGIDMTPMIDVIFQLIIFFMCVTDMADQSRAVLELPSARKAEPDVAEPGRLIINVTTDGDIIINGQPRSDGDLRDIFRLEAQTSPKDHTGAMIRPVYIRADRDVEFRHVHRVMNMAGQFELFRVMFNTWDTVYATNRAKAAAEKAASR